MTDVAVDGAHLRLSMGAGASPSRPRWGALTRYIREHRLISLATAVLGCWVVAMLAAPVLAPYGPLQQHIPDRLAAPSATHLFGTDHLGRDILSRVIYGSRVSIPVGIAIVAVAATVGTLVGAIAAVAGRLVNELIMRGADIFLAFPPIILALAIASVLGPSLINGLLALIIVWWPFYARLAFGTVRAIRHHDYVVAAEAMGAAPPRVLLRTLLPNAITPIIVVAILDIGNGIAVAAVLSFLGLGIQPPHADWGSLVAEGATRPNQWWIAAFPALAIMTVVLSFSLIGDGVRDRLDPRSQRT